MGPDHSPVVEEVEGDASEEQKALTHYDNTKEITRTFQSFEESEAKHVYTPEEIDEIIAENEKLKENEAKYQRIINNLKDKLKKQKRKTIDANSDKFKYFADKKDLEDFFVK